MSKETNKSQSFSSKIKSEIIGITPRTMTERQAVIAGVFCTSASEGINTPAHETRLNKECSDYLISLLKKEDIVAAREYLEGRMGEYNVMLPPSCHEEFDRVYGVCFTEGGLEVLSQEMSFARSFLRGAFISCGYCNDPEKTYRIELHLHNQGIVDIVYFMLESEGIMPSVKVRDTATVVYFANGDAVADFLTLIGATNSMLDFENIRAKHEFNRHLTKSSNCEDANSSRQANAAAMRNMCIVKLIESGIAIPDDLREAAEVQLANPEASITELGKLMNPPLGKSGMNHRLKRLIDLSNSLN